MPGCLSFCCTQCLHQILLNTKPMEGSHAGRDEKDAAKTPRSRSSSPSKKRLAHQPPIDGGLHKSPLCWSAQITIAPQTVHPNISKPADLLTCHKNSITFHVFVGSHATFGASSFFHFCCLRASVLCAQNNPQISSLANEILREYIAQA